MDASIAEYLRQWKMEPLRDRFDEVAAYRMPRSAYQILISSSSALVDIVLKLSSYNIRLDDDALDVVRRECRAHYPTAGKIILSAETVAAFRKFWVDNAGGLRERSLEIAAAANAGDMTLVKAWELIQTLVKMAEFHKVTVDLNVDLTPVIRRKAKQNGVLVAWKFAK